MVLVQILQGVCVDKRVLVLVSKEQAHPEGERAMFSLHCVRCVFVNDVFAFNAFTQFFKRVKTANTAIWLVSKVKMFLQGNNNAVTNPAFVINVSNTRDVHLFKFVDCVNLLSPKKTSTALAWFVL